MRDERDSKLLNVLVSCGVFFIAVCLMFTFMSSTAKAIEILSFFFLAFQFITGILIIVLALKISHKGTQLFLGLLLVFWGILKVLIEYIFVASIKEVWPLYGIAASILLFVSGLYKYQRLKFGYAIPSITLLGMSLWYSLFSFNIIKKSFLEVASGLGPFFMLLVAVILVVFFLLQKKHKELVFPDDEPGTFSDEDDEIMKQDL